MKLAQLGLLEWAALVRTELTYAEPCCYDASMDETVKLNRMQLEHLLKAYDAFKELAPERKPADIRQWVSKVLFDVLNKQQNKL